MPEHHFLSAGIRLWYGIRPLSGSSPMLMLHALSGMIATNKILTNLVLLIRDSFPFVRKMFPMINLHTTGQPPH